MQASLVDNYVGHSDILTTSTSKFARTIHNTVYKVLSYLKIKQT
jgi:hypothetical protein